MLKIFVVFYCVSESYLVSRSYTMIKGAETTQCEKNKSANAAINVEYTSMSPMFENAVIFSSKLWLFGV